jgi:Uma2 family endonuclease
MSTAYSLPESPIIDTDALYEMVHGVLVELPPMGARAAELAENLYLKLHAYGKGSDVGRAHHEMLFILNAERDLRRRPDVSFLLKGTLEKHPLPAKGDWAVTPELAVEVISPNDRMIEVERKIREYFDYGSHQVWIVLPEEKSVKIYYSPTDLRILLEQAMIVEEELLPGFSLELKDYFG